MTRSAAVRFCSRISREILVITLLMSPGVSRILVKFSVTLAPHWLYGKKNPCRAGKDQDRICVRAQSLRSPSMRRSCDLSTGSRASNLSGFPCQPHWTGFKGPQNIQFLTNETTTRGREPQRAITCEFQWWIQLRNTLEQGNPVGSALKHHPVAVEVGLGGSDCAP